MLSQKRFASVTADLLVRKGEAAPSLTLKRSFAWAQQASGVRQELASSAPPTIGNGPHGNIEPMPETAAQPVAKVDRPRLRRIVVNLTAAEYERLGIAAAKNGATRHEIVQATMHEYLDRLARLLDGACACLSNSPEAACPGTVGEPCRAEAL